MKCLVVKKVWLDKIFDEGKVWEMRTTRTNIRGKVGLIEAGSGLVVGEVFIWGTQNIPISEGENFIQYHQVEDLELLKKWKYAWFLRSAKRYETPIPYKHPQGAVIWVNLPEI